MIDNKKLALKSFVDFSNGLIPYPKYPLEIFIETSNVCNIQCAMCSAFSAINPKQTKNIMKTQRGFISLDHLKKMHEFLKHALIVHIFGYGEPTIHPDFKEILRFLFEYDLFIDFFTNGMKLDDELCEFIVRGKVGKITVSASFADRENYENIYIGAKFDTLINNLNRIKYYKNKYDSRLPLMEVNSLAFVDHINSLPEFVELMADSGIEVIQVKPLTGFFEIPEMHNHIAVYRESVEGEIINLAKKKAAEKGITLSTGIYEEACGIPDEANAGNIRKNRIKKWGKDQTVTYDEKYFVPVSEIKNFSKTVKKNKPSKLEIKRHNFRRVCAGSITDKIKMAEHYNFVQRNSDDDNYCMEPFKTLFVSVEGNIYPCCFGNTSCLPFGNISKQENLTAWNALPYTMVRENMLKNRYPNELCRACLKVKSFPKNHFVRMKANFYGKWFKEKYKSEFHPVLLKSLKNINNNDRILSSHDPSGQRHLVLKGFKIWCTTKLQTLLLHIYFACARFPLKDKLKQIRRR